MAKMTMKQFEQSKFDKEKLEERIAKMSGGVAVIRVGAPSESEMKTKKDALDDAISATKAAVAEGIVPGGGVALLRAAKALDSLKLAGDEAIARAEVGTLLLDNDDLDYSGGVEMPIDDAIRAAMRAARA